MHKFTTTAHDTLKRTTGRSVQSPLGMLITAVAVLFVALPASAEESGKPPALSSAFIFPAGYVSYNVRNGYRKFDGTDEYIHVPQKNIFILGGAAGKRFALNERLRIQTTLELGWGSVKEDEFYDYIEMDGHIAAISLYDKCAALTGGIQADVHRLFPVDQRIFFISAGIGAYVTYFTWQWHTSLGKKIPGTEFSTWTVSPGLNVGAGVEYKISDKSAAALSYNLRFLMTGYNTEYTNTFPMGVDYREFTYSHMLQLQILLPNLRYGKFY